MRTQLFISFFVAVLLAVGGKANAEACNPIIDGTYCATQMPKKKVSSTPPSGKMRPIQDMTRHVPSNSVGGSQPATLGGISFQGNSRCVGLLRRSACD
jgi:hypothetical protein